MPHRLILTDLRILGLILGGLLVAVLFPGADISAAQAPLPVQIPQIVTSLDFGVPAGDGLYPARIAIDSDRRRIYLFNNGDNQAGNTISVFDLTANQFVALVALQNPGEYTPPTPMEIKVDPYRTRLYAITGDPYADTTQAEMFVLDTNTLRIVERIRDVETMEPGPDALYLANDVQLWKVDPERFAEQGATILPYRRFNTSMLLNPSLNRLYLLRAGPSELVVFDSENLASLSMASFTGRLRQLVLHSESGRLFLLEASGDDRAVVRILDPTGTPVTETTAIEVSTAPYMSDYVLMASDGHTLYLGSGPYDACRITAYRLPDLRPQPGAFLIRRPDQMVADRRTGLLYALHTSWFGPLVTIDPARAETVHITYTALSVRDVLPDPTTGRLYVLDDAGNLYVLDLKDYHEIARVETGFAAFPDNWGDYGQISLDASRNRLYLDGNPIRVVDTRDWDVTVYPELAGQLAVESPGDRLYLTPWCQCRREPCNTFVVDAETMTIMGQLFPPMDPLTAECPTDTYWDALNQLLYVRINNGVPGSNSGSYFAVFDVSDSPRLLYTHPEINFGPPALDSTRRRAYMTRYRLDRSFIYQFEVRDGSVYEARVLAGAGGYLAYDGQNERLFSLSGDTLQVFDSALSLVGEMVLPDPNYRLLDMDTANQRLYLGDPYGQLLVVATSGGDLASPAPVSVSFTSFTSPQQLLAASDGTLFRVYEERLYRSADGQHWDLLGRGLPGRPVCALTLSPNFAQDRTLFAGLHGYGRLGGLYRSTDGGDTWLPTMRGLSDTEICKLAISPTFERDRVVFGASYLRGLFRSNDGGDSWEWLANRYAAEDGDLSVRHIALSPNFVEDGIAMIARDTVLRSADRGMTWDDTGVPGGLLAFSPNFASDRMVLSDGAWRSEDGGLTWQPSARGLSGNGAQNILFSPRFLEDQTVYRMDTAGVLQRSTDRGYTWQTLQGGLPPDFHPSAFVLLPDGALFIMSSDGHRVTIPPDQLIWESQPVWREEITQLDLHDIVALSDGSLLAAYGTMGVLRSTDRGRTWSSGEFPLRGSLTDRALLAVAQDGTVFAAVGGAMERSDDNGRTWRYLDGVPRGFEATSLAVSPNYRNDGIVLAGGTGRHGTSIIRSDDRGETWTVVFDASEFQSTMGMTGIDAIAFSPDFAESQAAFAWLNYGGLLVSTDGGRSWHLRSEDMNRYSAQALVFSPDGKQLYLAALHGYVFVSFDRGQSWNDWSSGIPDPWMWSGDLLFDESGMLYLATDVGVYRSWDAGKMWQRASLGLPIDETTGAPYGVRALTAHGGTLYAALWQGGVFASTNRGDTWYSTLTGEDAPIP